MDPADGPARLEDGAALDAFLDEHDLALVEFYTKGCAMCQAMEPVLGNVARAADVAVGLVNPGDDVLLVARFDVRSVPTLVLFRDGEEIARRAGGSRGRRPSSTSSKPTPPERPDPSGDAGSPVGHCPSSSNGDPAASGS